MQLRVSSMMYIGCRWTKQSPYLPSTGYPLRTDMLVVRVRRNDNKRKMAMLTSSSSSYTSSPTTSPSPSKVFTVI
jgi:hypothetical protein